MRLAAAPWWRYVLVVLAVGTVAAVVWRVLHPPMSPEERCLANLHAIADAIERYKADHNGELPVYFVPRGVERPGLRPVKELEEMSLYPKYIKDPRVFLCPSCPEDTLETILGRKFKVCYGYQLSGWLYPGNKLKGRSARDIFYNEIVPNYEVRITQCSCHPRKLAFVILLDNPVVVAERPHDYDGHFGRIDLFPELREELEELKRRGVDPWRGIYPKRPRKPAAHANPKREGGQRR